MTLLYSRNESFISALIDCLGLFLKSRRSPQAPDRSSPVCFSVNMHILKHSSTEQGLFDASKEWLVLTRSSYRDVSHQSLSGSALFGTHLNHRGTSVV